MNDKDFFKTVKKHSLENADTIYEGFPYFAMKIIFPDLSEDVIDNSIYGLSGNDDSVDAFHINEETKEIYIIQFKSAISLETMKPVKKEWLSYHYDIQNKLKSDDYISSHKNERIKDIAADYAINKKKNYEVKFIFAHLGYNPNRDILDVYQNFVYLDFSDLKDKYLEYITIQSNTEPEFIDLKINYDKDPDVIEKKVGKHRTLISLVTGDEIVRLRKEFKYKLFDKNLRFSLGKNSTNKKIISTAKEDRSNFYFYNNGITITSTNFKYKKNANSVKMEYPQIINGAQTVNAIYEAYQDRINKLKREKSNLNEAEFLANEEFSDIKVLFRVICDPNKDSTFEHKVIEANNTQNIIQKRDFYSNEPEQVELQRMFAKYGYFYEIKRGERDYIKKEEHNLLKCKLRDFEFQQEKIDIEKIASIWMSYSLAEPNSKSVGKERIFGAEKYYDLIFPERKEDITDNFVKEMILAYNIFDILDKESRIFRGANSLQKVISEIDISGNFIKAQQIILKSIIFNKTLKSKFVEEDQFKKKKDAYIKRIKKFLPFSQGKYFVLAIFKFIFDECEYLDTLLATDLYKNKKFIKEKIVENWLNDILTKIVIPEFDKFVSEIGSSLGAFYLSQKNFNNISERFIGLDVELDKSFTDIFPLNLGSK